MGLIEDIEESFLKTKEQALENKAMAIERARVVEYIKRLASLCTAYEELKLNRLADAIERGAHE
ncbi:MAG: hypothetical protein ACRBBM_18190 [Pseudomonadaceae bacterium]